MSYSAFLKTKAVSVAPSGFEPKPLNLRLFEFQRDIVGWALKRGRASVFADCGLGKTPMQLEWATHVVKEYKRPVLILAPLAVSKQTEREGLKFDIPVKAVASDIEIREPGVFVTNYEKLQHFDSTRFAGIVLDESSILKSFTGATRNLLIEKFHNTPMKLCCTATPAPNDFMELGNHSEFLGVLTRTEMLSTFFVHDGGDTAKWRLKGHAEEEYWKWICQWAVMIRKPSDLGYSDKGFDLPPLNLHHVIVDGRNAMEGFLFPVEARTLEERRGVRCGSMWDRVKACADLVNSSKEPWLVWCGLNAEGDMLEEAIPDAVQVAGADRDSDKEDRMFGFADGRFRVLVSKSKIAGFGMNFQVCPNVAFVGLSDSYEEFYQSVRRVYRFGQARSVNAYIITCEQEGAVVKNIERKEKDAMRMAQEMVKHMSVYNTESIRTSTIRTATEYQTNRATGEGWIAELGDSVETIKEIPSGSIHYTIFSPPFASLYTYSASDRDLGNCRTDSEFYEHFTFLIAEMLRVTRPGRLLSFHCMDIPAMKERDGVIGLKDFPGDLIRMFQSAGFIYHSRVVIWKDPLIEATRTKALGLMHKQVTKDSAMCRQGLPDYLITVRKPGINTEPVSRPNGFEEFIGEDEPKARKGRPVVRQNDIENYRATTADDPVYSHQVWQRYASPVWMDVNASRTLQKDSAREDKDERHICPLQLDVIERAVELWSNRGDTIYSPFMGIGSEGHVALLKGRKFHGCELKESYYKQAVGNLIHAAKEAGREGLFANA